MASLMPNGKQQYHKDGVPLAGGKVHTYAAGTSTPLATYSDQAGSVPNANPVILDANGEATIFWAASPYKVVVQTSADAEVWTQDNVQPLAGAADLSNTSSASLGDALIGVKSTAAGSVARTQHLKNAEKLSVRDFGVSSANTAAINQGRLQAAIDAAFAENVRLDVNESFSCEGGVTVPHGTIILGRGKGRTAITFEGMAGTENGFDIQEGSTFHDLTAIGGMSIVIKGDNGASGIKCPRGTTVWNTNRPRYLFRDMVFRGDVMSVDAAKQGLYDYAWAKAIELGDSMQSLLEMIEVYGSYDYTLDPAGQDLTRIAFDVSCTQNEGGMLQPRLNHVYALYVPIGLQFGYRVSQPFVENFQFHRGWIGINSPHASSGTDYSVLEGFFAKGNINSQYKGIVMNTAAFMDFDGVRTTRAASGFDHASGWWGYDLDGVDQLNIRGDSRGYKEGAQANSTHIALDLSNCDYVDVDGFVADSTDDAIIVTDCTRVALQAPTCKAVTRGVSVNGTVAEIDIDAPRFTSGVSEANRIIYGAGVDRGAVTVRHLNKGPLETVDASVTALSAAGTTQLTWRVDNVFKRYQANTGAGAYTHNLDFLNTNAKIGMVWPIHITLTASANPTIVLRDASAVTLLSLNNTSGATQRYAVELYFNGTVWRIKSAAASLA